MQSSLFTPQPTPNAVEQKTIETKDEAKAVENYKNTSAIYKKTIQAVADYKLEQAKKDLLAECQLMDKAEEAEKAAHTTFMNSDDITAITKAEEAADAASNAVFEQAKPDPILEGREKDIAALKKADTFAAMLQTLKRFDASQYSYLRQGWLWFSSTLDSYLVVEEVQKGSKTHLRSIFTELRNDIAEYAGKNGYSLELPEPKNTNKPSL